MNVWPNRLVVKKLLQKCVKQFSFDVPSTYTALIEPLRGLVELVIERNDLAMRFYFHADAIDLDNRLP